jgi:hypothetical protein
MMNYGSVSVKWWYHPKILDFLPMIQTEHVFSVDPPMAMAMIIPDPQKWRFPKRGLLPGTPNIPKSSSISGDFPWNKPFSFLSMTMESQKSHGHVFGRTTRRATLSRSRSLRSRSRRRLVVICCDAMVSCDGNEYDIYWDVIHGI